MEFISDTGIRGTAILSYYVDFPVLHRSVVSVVS